MQLSLVIDPLVLETPRVLFDISRLLRRRDARFATGVDRIDLAIGLDLATRLGEACRFVYATPLGPSILSHATGLAVMRAVARRWQGGERPGLPLGALAAGLGRRVAEPAKTTYVVASHSGLALQRGGLDRLDRQRLIRRLCYLHDLIPLEYPEYQRPGAGRRLAAMLAEIAAGPAAFATNSADTAARLAAHARRMGWPAPAIQLRVPRIEAVAPHGAVVDASGRRGLASAPLREEVRALVHGARPYFLCVGTIEPRKNHLLLLHLWRDLAASGGGPALVIAGRRGWENEMVLDMLDRCLALTGNVHEFGDLSDGEVAALMHGAQALLIPSFAEGLGVPVLEARALGTPVIAADLPAMREVAAPGTAFLSPLDGPGWAAAITQAAARARPAV